MTMDLNKLDIKLVEALKHSMLGRAQTHPDVEGLTASAGIQRVPPLP